MRGWRRFGVYVKAGGVVTGFDIDPVMIEKAKNRLNKAGQMGQVKVGGVELMSQFGAQSIDCLIALNTLAYFTDAEEEVFYCEVARVAKPGGSLIITHSNELFDMFTFNALTITFCERHFCGLGTRDKIAALVTHPDVPQRVHFNIRENPLNYRYKLAQYGFKEVRQEFINFHPLPPLLMDPQGFVDIDKREYLDTLGWNKQDRWKLMFQCSMFGSHSIKQ